MKRLLFSFLLLLGGIGTFSVPQSAEALSPVPFQEPSITISAQETDPGKFTVSPGDEVTVTLTQANTTSDKGKLLHQIPAFFSNIHIQSNSGISFAATAAVARKNNTCFFDNNAYKPSISCYSFPKNAIISYTATISESYSSTVSALYTKVLYQNQNGRSVTIKDRKIIKVDDFWNDNEDEDCAFSVSTGEVTRKCNNPPAVDWKAQRRCHTTGGCGWTRPTPSVTPTPSPTPNNCASEGQVTNLTIPNSTPCCPNLSSFYLGQPGMTGSSSLCYSPSQGIPTCSKKGTAQEGWYYANGKLLSVQKCDFQTTVSPTLSVSTTQKTVVQGEDLNFSWTISNLPSNARVGFALVNTQTGKSVVFGGGAINSASSKLTICANCDEMTPAPGQYKIVADIYYVPPYVSNVVITAESSVFTIIAPPKDSALTVSLSPSSPSATSVPCNAQSVPFVKYNLTAGSRDAMVSLIFFMRSGLGSNDDFSQVWVEDEAGVRLSNPQAVEIDGSVGIKFNTPLIIKKGQTRTISVVAKLKAFNDVNNDGIKQATESCYAGRSNAFGISFAVHITTDGTISGAFPIVGARMQIVDAPLTVSTLKFYYDGEQTPTFSTENISQENALNFCIDKHNNNPTRSIKCTWNGNEIYSFTPSSSPTATISPSTGAAPLNVTFTLFAQDNTGTNGVNYWADFGDGSARMFSRLNGGVVQSYIYTTPGTYTAKIMRYSGCTYSPSTSWVCSQSPTVVAQSLITVNAVPTSPFTVLSPNGGETYKVGDRVVIRTQSPSLEAGKTLKYVLIQDRDGNGTYESRAQMNVENNSDGTVSWIIPDMIGGTGTVGTLNKFSFEVFNSATGAFTPMDTSDGNFTITEATAPKGIYKGYLNGSTSPFITTASISQSDALANCQLNHNSNPTKSIRCTWNETEIYSFTPQTTTTLQEAIAFGVYEGLGQKSSYMNHPEQTVYLAIPASAQGKVLVLTAYEPINWILRNPSNITPTKIVTIGYYAQRVTSSNGLVLPPVENNSLSGNGVFQYAYQSSDAQFTNLVTWLKTKNITLSANNFTGSYSAKDNSLFLNPTPTVVSNLNISENSGYSTAQTTVAGSQNITIGKFAFVSNNSSDIRVTRLKFSLVGGGINGADIPAATIFVDGVPKGTVQSFTTGVNGAVYFSSVDFTIPANRQAVVELKANLTNSAAGTLQVQLSGIEAKDTSSSYATINNVSTTTPAVNAVPLSVISTGILSIANNSSTPASSIVSPKTAETSLGIFTLSAQDDDIKVTNMHFRTVGIDGVTPTNIATRIRSIALYNNEGVKVTDGVINGTTGYVYFDIGNSSNLIIPKNNSTYKLFVSATFNPITTSDQSGSVIKLALDGKPIDAVSGTAATGIRAVSISNNNVLTSVTETGSVESQPMFLTKTSLSFASVDDSSLVTTSTPLQVNSAMKAYAFTVTANPAGDAELASVVLGIAKTSGVTVSNVKVYEKGKESTILYSGLYTSGSQLNFTSPQRISAGTTKTYIVELNVSAVTGTSPSLSLRLLLGTGDTTFGKVSGFILPNSQTVWSDLSDTSHSSTLISGKDWFTGSLLDGVNSMSSRSYSTVWAY